MRKTIALLLITSLLAGCSSSDDSDTENTTDAVDDSAADMSDNPTEQIPTTAETQDDTTISGGNNGSALDSTTSDTESDPIAGTDDDASLQSPDTTESTDDVTDDVTDDATDDVTDIDSSVQGQALALDVVARDILNELAGTALVQFANGASEQFNPVLTTAIDSTALAQEQFSFVDRGETLQLPIDRVQYSCSGGGTVVQGIGVSAILESEYSHTTDVNSWLFDSCLTMLDGQEITISGELSTVFDSVSGNRFSRSEATYTFASFSLGNTFEATATVNSLNSNPEGDLSLSLDANIERFSENAGADDALTITQATLSQEFTNTGFGALLTYTLSASGTIVGQLTDNAVVTVDTESPLEERLENQFPDQFYTFTGQLSMSAENGAELTISANPERNEEGERRVDYLSLSAAGDQTLSTVVLEEISFTLEE